jgi:hypothetical protein
MTGAGSRHFGLMVATLFVVSMGAGAARAYTPEQQQACSGDAMRLCGAYVPDVDRITACMIQNKSQLSPGCRVHFRPGSESGEAAAAAADRPMAVEPAVRKSTKPRKPKKPAKSET